MPALHPLTYLLVLMAAVGLGLPGGALVVGAGALFGPWIGLITVLAGQALGLMLNWRLCRGVLRQRVQRWLGRQRRGRRLHRLLQRPASLRLLVLLRLSLIPMNLVNAACALGPTPLPRYALGSLMLVPRFALLVQAGSVGSQAARGSLSPLALAGWSVALTATAAVLVLLARSLQAGLLMNEVKDDNSDNTQQ
jgi:uncharacterized membrane protein YdjX (TVP38/TMEM64 family)